MKKLKFSFIDIIIILAVLAVVVVGLKLVMPGLVSNVDKQTVHYTVLANKVDSGASDLIKVGDEVRISFSEDAYATVLGVNEEPCEELRYFMPKGMYMTHKIEGKSDVKILLSCEAEVTDTKISNNNVPIRVGEWAVVHSKGYTFTGYIIEIEEGQGEE